ncbi:hypothetical protein [Streptomyces sp. NPDC003710]
MSVKDPGPGSPEWAAALQELGEALEYLKAADPVARGALVDECARHAARRMHPHAHDSQPVVPKDSEQAVAFAFRTGHDAGGRYGVVNADGRVSPVGLCEYVSSAERAFLQRLVQERLVEHGPAGPSTCAVRWCGSPVPAVSADQWHADGAA